MNLKRIKSLLFASVFVVGSLTTTLVSARTHGYDIDVPSFNGSGYAQGDKYYDGGTGYVYSDSIGGNYKLDCRMWQSGKATAWKRIDDNTTASHNLSGFKGKVASMPSIIELVMSNDLITPVKVNAIGTWDPN